MTDQSKFLNDRGISVSSSKINVLGWRRTVYLYFFNQFDLKFSWW